MTEPIRPDEPHDEAEALLPWYATGQLDIADRARVEEHLASCAHCQRQLRFERRLAEEFPALAPEVDSGWARLRRRVEAAEAPRYRAKHAGTTELWQFLRRPAVAALATAQIGFLVIAGAVVLSLERTPYQALSAPQQPSAANIVVMFRPESTEAELRKLLDSSGATLVGGPTEADAYLLHVPAGTRPRALAALRTDPRVTMAQPIDEAQP